MASSDSAMYITAGTLDNLLLIRSFYDSAP